MKQILMLSKRDYFVTDRDTVVGAINYVLKVRGMWNKLYREQGRPSTEPVADKELWDNRTYSELIHSDRQQRAYAQRVRSPRRWVAGGKEKADVLKRS